jgi:hypothetical protein
MTITVILLPNNEKIAPIEMNTGNKYLPIKPIKLYPNISIDKSLTGIS